MSWMNISIHDAEVKESRAVLKDLINATCLLDKHQLAFRGSNENT